MLPLSALSGNSEDPHDKVDLRGKRILLLFPHAVTPGGALHYAVKLAELLAKEGATVGFLTLRIDTGRYKLPAGIDILSVVGPLTSELRYWLLLPLWQAKINRMMNGWAPDVLVPQVFPANWWAWLYKLVNRRMKIVWVCPEPSAFIHSRNWINAITPFWKRYLAIMARPFFSMLDIALSRFSDRIVANSAFTAGLIDKIYGRKSDAIAYPAIDFRIFHPGSAEKKNEIISVAKLSRFKRVDFLLRVFSLLLKSNPDLTYHIVGRGEDEEALKAATEKLGISSRVRFHGNVDNDRLADLYRQSMLFLHGSIEEPFGMAPLEAIACGTPVIAHKSGGPLEFVNNGCGRLIDSLTEERWSEEISAFLTMLKGDAEYFGSVSSNAQKFVWNSTLLPIARLISDL
jgi:glycosyltransferase involved in cell wall biosynthesis